MTACSSSSGDTAATPAEAGAPLDSGAEATTNDAASGEVRGQRYCEILLAKVNGGQVHVDVYNTFGLNDCPDVAWSKVDAAQVATDTGATMAILNGPRYWMMSGFEGSSFLDPTPRTVGGIAMRLAGGIDLPLASVSSFGKAPYTANTIQRNTTVRFDAGKSVFELVGPDGKIYDMQSYSVQKVMQTEADLATLGARLTLPTGWTFRTRTLTDALRITATAGLATVLQDDLGNTYQLSRQ